MGWVGGIDVQCMVSWGHIQYKHGTYWWDRSTVYSVMGLWGVLVG